MRLRLRRAPDDGTAGGGPADPELEAWRAEEAAREAKAKAVQDAAAAAAAAAAPKPPPQDAPPPASEQKKAAAAEPNDMHRQIAGLGVWGLDFVAVRWFGKHYRLEPDERAELERLATPVVQKWLPDLTGELGPEEAFIVGALMIYGAKWWAGPPAAQAADMPTGAGPAPQDGRAGGPPRLEVVDAQVKHG